MQFALALARRGKNLGEPVQSGPINKYFTDGAHCMQSLSRLSIALYTCHRLADHHPLSLKIRLSTENRLYSAT